MAQIQWEVRDPHPLALCLNCSSRLGSAQLSTAQHSTGPTHPQFEQPPSSTGAAPRAFLKFSATTYSLPLAGNTDWHLEKDAKGHFCVSCTEPCGPTLVAMHHALANPSTIQPTRGAAARLEQLNTSDRGGLAVLTSVMEPAKFWFMTFSKSAWSRARRPIYSFRSSLLLWCRLSSFSDIIKCHKPWLLVHKTFPAMRSDVSVAVTSYFL